MSRAIFCLVALIAAAPAWSQPPARDTPVPVHGTGTIRGRVVEAGSGRPLSRVEIRASGSTPASAAAALTDGEGRYELTELAAGSYTVSATKPNYVRTSWGEQRVEGPGKRIVVADGQRLASIDLVLRRGGVITGKIVDEFGDPISDVFVSAMRYQYTQGSRRLMSVGRGSPTNDIGDYRVYGLPPGQYVISATLRSVMGPGMENDRTGYAATLYPGTANVAEAQRLSIAPGQTIANINLALLPIQTAKVSGTALDVNGRPLANAMIMVMQRIGTMFAGGPASPVRADGTFMIPNLTPGDYTLRVNSAGGESASADITVTGADLTDVVLAVTKPSLVRGRIVFTESATATAPPAATSIDLGASRESSLGQGTWTPARIESDGTFELSVAPGRVQLRGFPRLPAGDRPWRLSRVLMNGVDVFDTGIDVPANGRLDNVIVELTNHVGEASGRVTDADGNVVRDCYVIVFAQDPAHWTVQTRHLSVARPAADDLYRARLLPGDYYAVAMSDVENGAWTDPEFLALARDRATKFSIADGENKTLDLRLIAAPPI
jgi:hypothetical protein